MAEQTATAAASPEEAMVSSPDSPELREVTGPTALGGGWRRSLDLLYLISINDFKKTYFDTVLGYVWSLFRPLILFAVLLFVFTQIFRIGDDVPAADCCISTPFCCSGCRILEAERRG